MKYNLIDVRRDKKLTQAEVAQMANVTPATYNRFENGKAIPKPKTCKKIALALGIEDWWELLDTDSEG